MKFLPSTKAIIPMMLVAFAAIWVSKRVPFFSKWLA
jgi:hypothetical protein